MSCLVVSYFFNLKIKNYDFHFITCLLVFFIGIFVYFFNEIDDGLVS